MTWEDSNCLAAVANQLAIPTDEHTDAKSKWNHSVCTLRIYLVVLQTSLQDFPKGRVAQDLLCAIHRLRPIWSQSIEAAFPSLCPSSMPCVASGVGSPEPRFCLPSNAKSRAATRIIWGPMGATNVGRAWPNARELWGDGRSTGGFLAVPTPKIIFYSRYCSQLFPSLLVGLRCTWNSSIAKWPGRRTVLCQPPNEPRTQLFAT